MLYNYCVHVIIPHFTYFLSCISIGCYFYFITWCLVILACISYCHLLWFVFFFFFLVCFACAFLITIRLRIEVWSGECGWSWLDEHCSFASSTVCIDCGFALFSFYRCHCVPLFVHAERINYWLTDWRFLLVNLSKFGAGMLIKCCILPSRNIKSGKASGTLPRTPLGSSKRSSKPPSWI